MQFGQKPTFFFKLLKKLKNLYIVIGDKNGLLATASFSLDLATRAIDFYLVKSRRMVYDKYAAYGCIIADGYEV